ncbi:MAG: CsbD family protein [Chloroflexi bacterium]|nr:CsbD family protein [Chloroflexota bacterium]
MNQDIFEGKWKEMRGQVKEWWGELTDDDLDRVEGKAEQLVGLLQQKYGYTKERAQEEYDRRVAQYNERLEAAKVD